MKFKKVLNKCYLIFTIVCLVAMPKIWIYADSLRTTPGVAHGGELLLPLIPLIVYIAYKNYKDTPHSKEDYKD